MKNSRGQFLIVLALACVSVATLAQSWPQASA